MTRAGAAVLRRAENQLIEAVHVHIRSGAGEPLVARILEPELRPVAEQPSVRRWRRASGAEAVRTQALVYTHFALNHVDVLEQHWRLRMVDEQQGRVRASAAYCCRLGCDDREAIDVTAASVGFMVNILDCFGETVVSRRALLDLLREAPSFQYRMKKFSRECNILVHPAPGVRVEGSIDRNFIESINRRLTSMDRFMAAIDPQWRTERGEPWRLLTQWRRARDYYPLPEPELTATPIRPAMLEAVGTLTDFSRWKDNYGSRWFRIPISRDNPMLTYAYLPWQVRFASEHPELQAQLSEASHAHLGPDGKDTAVDGLLYQAFQIMCGYTDIIDCADPHALMH